MIGMATETIMSVRDRTGPATDRVARLREQYFTFRPAVCIERALAYTRSYRETEGLVPSLRRAQALRRVCREKSVTILPDELIVGMPGFQPRAGIFCPEIAWHWLADELDTIAIREQDPYDITKEDKRRLRAEVFPYWEGRSAHEFYQANLPDDTRRIACETGIIDIEIKSANGPGEFSPGYGNILLKKGFKGVAADAAVRLAELDRADPAAFDKTRFLEAVVVMCAAARELAERYADEAERLADEAERAGAAAVSPAAGPGAAAVGRARAGELRRVAGVCRRVPWEPPATFHEALQAIWFCQVLLLLEENAPSYSPGRMDQYLYPLYEADIAAGRLTPRLALELLECFWIKTAGHTWLLNENCSKYFAGYMPFQNVNVGGTTADGGDAANDLSWLMVQASMDLCLFQPSLSVFVDDVTSDEFLRHVCKLIRLGTGIPALHSVGVTKQMMRRKGVGEEDVENYCMVGCVEPNVHGQMSQWSDGGHYNFGAAVQFALDDGWSWLDGEQLGVRTGRLETLATFDDFKDAVKRQLALFIEQIAVANLVAQKAHAVYLPKPLSSALVEGCVESATDMTEGGARYNAGPAFIGTGIADLADSLAAVRKLVYEDKRVAPDELVAALKNDFVGYEHLWRMLMYAAPKYGNDDDSVDELAREFTDYAADLIDGYRGYCGCPIINGLYPVSSHVPHGKVVGALPSGRRAGTPLADGCSPFHGHDTLGPTAAMKSVARIDHQRHTAGTLLNMKLNPDLVQDDRGLGNLAALIRSYFRLGGYHIQFNVVSGETLRAAQERPDDYRGLMVRVAGYSAYFADLCREIQDDIIVRTEHRVWSAS
jgi:choline trimethylamine-lyase